MNIASTVNAAVIAYASRLAPQQAAAEPDSEVLQQEMPQSGPMALWLNAEAFEASRQIPVLSLLGQFA